MIPLVFVDVDGTLVGSSGDVRPEVWAAADRARASGIRLVLCSGRPAFGTTRGYAVRLDPDGWHVFQNGASVVRPATGESRSHGLPPGAPDWLVARAAETDRVLELYTDTEMAVERDTDRARRHAGLLGVPFAPRPFASLAGAIVRAQWLVAREDADAVAAEPHDGLTYLPSVSPVMPDTAFVNITAAGVDKALALRLVAEAYGVPVERAMMVGDGANDATAMRAVGFPVAMGNAEPEALAAARTVVRHVDELGLVDALALAERL
jgi:Cof subfamily protein (haloacid dehalogenase superfamily)